MDPIALLATASLLGLIGVGAMFQSQPAFKTRMLIATALFVIATILSGWAALIMWKARNC